MIPTRVDVGLGQVTGRHAYAIPSGIKESTIVSPRFVRESGRPSPIRSQGSCRSVRMPGPSSGKRQGFVYRFVDLRPQALAAKSCQTAAFYRTLVLGAERK
jgi:hypothetical protein